MAKQEITLEPGESGVVSFETTPSKAKTYYVSVNGLSGSFVALSAFDPWSYDFNGDGYIDDSERLKAVQDHYAGIITREQLDQVLALPSPPTPPPPPPPPPPPTCIPHSEKLEAIENHYDGLITRAELDAILAIPTCP